MKSLLLFTVFCIKLCFLQAQQVDTVIEKGVYTSYFSYQLHEPLYVTYKLYQGGGTCSRASFRFIADGLPNSATARDYRKNGYDIGHMANAADFAGDCKKEELTFRFYNALPQTAKLNRGVWKSLETTIRKESQTDSLLIMCGGIFGDKTIGPGKIAVPDFCWKVVRSLTTGQVTHCMIFPNDNSNTYEDIEPEELAKRLQYSIK